MLFRSLFSHVLRSPQVRHFFPLKEKIHPTAATQILEQGSLNKVPQKVWTQSCRKNVLVDPLQTQDEFARSVERPICFATYTLLAQLSLKVANTNCLSSVSLAKSGTNAGRPLVGLLRLLRRHIYNCNHNNTRWFRFDSAGKCTGLPISTTPVSSKPQWSSPIFILTNSNRSDRLSPAASEI